jgi:ERCC4-related helicase
VSSPAPSVQPPATLRECAFKISYGPADDRLNGFYIPALSVSVRYDRAAGFFSSTALSVAAQGIAKLIQNGGRMRLLVGAELSEEDVEAIRRGAELAERLSSRLLDAFTDPVDELQQRRLEALAWMVADGTLEIKVVLPKGPNGHPLPADQAADYYHPKEGIFNDAAGDQLAFSGSVNESRTGWQNNYEQFAVYKSWDASRPYLMQAVYRFERLWNGQEPDWVALPVPEAVRQRLIRYRPGEAPKHDPLEKPRIPEERLRFELAAEPTEMERIVFQFLRDAPKLFNAGDLPTATSAVSPWPHQMRVVRDVVQRYPQSFLLCDEVGLGKTIEAALILRHLYLTGMVRRCLILAPKSLARQWQEELYEKAVLNVPLFDGFALQDYFQRELPINSSNPFEAAPLTIVSSQLAKRRERRELLLSAEPWDLVIVDEAHHARRREFGTNRFRPNRMLELLLRLKERTRSLLFLTATPMQISPVEVWDLLRLLGMGGKWAASEHNFVRFFQELQRDPGERDWQFLAEMFRDWRQDGGAIDPQFEEVARATAGPVEWDAIVRELSREDSARGLRLLSEKGKAVASELLRRHTPLRTFAHRNTRHLLREYRQRGLLADNIPTRDPQPIWIHMRPDEDDLYHRVEEYISEFYHRYEDERRGLGFVMTVYRRRLTSSFYALERSLERRLAFIRGEGLPFDDDDLEQADLEEDVSEEQEALDRRLFQAEVTYIQDFLHEIHRLQGDSKFERLCEDLRAILQRHERLVIFTQYADTIDYLRDKLREVYGSQAACYSGRGGEVWNGVIWLPTSKEEVKNRFREGIVKILVCTEAASEGINLQTCGVLINYDMPWNPMRVEQRIGRIDRIGQVYERVLIHHYFYEETVEEKVYQALSHRIGWFQEIVGELQPILSQARKAIERAALAKRDERDHILSEEVNRLQEEIERRKAIELNVDECLAQEPEAAHVGPQRLNLQVLETTLTEAACLRGVLQPDGGLSGAYALSGPEGRQQLVTFRPEIFDAHPDSVRLLTFGDELFDRLIGSVESPARSDYGCVCRAVAASEGMKVVGYFRADGSAIEAPAEIAAACQAGIRGSGADQFEGAVAGVGERRLAQVGEGLRRRRAADRRTLEEESREVLRRAAAVDTILQRQQEFGSVPVPAGQHAVKSLARHGYPFAGLLRILQPKDRSIDGLVREHEGRTLPSLRSLFEADRKRAGDLLQQLAADRSAGGLEEITVDTAVDWYGTSVGSWRLVD